MEIFDAYEQAKKDVDAVTETSNLLRTFQDEESMRYHYRAVGGTIFEPLNLQDMSCSNGPFGISTYSTVCVLSTDSNSTCVMQSMSSSICSTAVSRTARFFPKSSSGSGQCSTTRSTRP